MKKSDKVPVIRSFLLQLLLEHNTENVKGHLRSYFNLSQHALVVGEGVDQELCLLCTRCFEDALDKEHSGLALEEQMNAATELLSSGMETLTRFAGFTLQDISLELLEGVAKVRYALLIVAQLIQLQVNEVGGDPSFSSHTHNLYRSIATRLLDEARRACTAEGVNSIDATGEINTTGPIVYLLKLLMRQSGISCLKKAVEKYHWVVPMELRRAEDEKTLDPFVIYNPAYSALREAVTLAAYGRDYKALEDSSAALQPQEYVPLLLSMYQVVTMSRASTLPSMQLLPEVLGKLNDVIINCKALPMELKLMARGLVSNEQGGPLAALQVSPGQPGAHRTLAGVVMHTAASLHSRRKVELLYPLVTMLCKPGDMANAYLPTMPEDMLPEARRIITGGQFYECPNGHPYLVGECGKPMVQTVCNICASAIGGQNSRPVDGNRTARSTDVTQTGHCLGHPTAREAVPSPERALSPAACCILRAIMHSALLWASCSPNTATEGLLALVKAEGLRPPELPEFFWGHLERDLLLLSSVLGKNVDETAIVVHLVLRNILTSGHSHVTSILKSLGDRNAREEWETHFSHNYIQPVLEKLEDKLGHAIDVILGDNKQDHDPLFYLVYERMPVVQESLEPHLWGYRPRITLEHLTQYMQQRKGTFPILKEFLKEEHVLRATQYLPDIVRLQRQMFDMFNHRIDHRVAREKTMKQFIHDSWPSESQRNEYRQMVGSVQNAWALVRDKLRDHAQLRVKDEYLKTVIDLDAALEYFIPTTTGPGACTFALVHYLVYMHNNFIDWCRGKNKASTWQNHKVQLPYIHACHLLDYHSQLQSILLSHCHYSLRVGRGHEVSYDLPALEKHILQRFIHGKPRILVDILQVSYQKDVYTAATFSAVRKKVAKQVSLPPRVQTDILLELRSPDMMRKSLDVVDIVLGFLTSGGGRPKTRLVSYLRRLKMEKKAFSEVAKEHCNLEHILSLWQTLSVGLARIITLSGQEPFDTLNAELLEDLTETQHHQLDQALPKYDLGTLLSTLYEFIETYIRHIDMNMKILGMADILRVHLEINELVVPEELPEFPKDITLAQTVATWKYIVHFQARQRQD